MNKHHGKKLKTQMLLQESFHNTKNFFYKTFQNLKSRFLKGYQKLPKATLAIPISLSKTTKLPDLDVDPRDFSDKNEMSEEKTKGEEIFNGNPENLANQRVLKESKEEKSGQYSEGKHVDSLLENADALAKKMKELEMMDVNDMDHALDIEEVLHYHSRLTCPAYQDIVDKFFMDMYTQYYLPPPSAGVHGSMRKLGSVSVHSSSRSLCPIKL